VPAWGQAICRLRVVGPDRNPPGVFKALVRAVIFQILPDAALLGELWI
jgi:hypothetical protein